jgi:hypothetical protein
MVNRLENMRGYTEAAATYGSRVAREYEGVPHGAVHTYVISQLKASDQSTARCKTMDIFAYYESLTKP